MIRYIKLAMVDIKNGENLDSYLTIILSIVIATLGLLGAASSQIVSAAILGILALVGNSLLISRRSAQEVKKAAEQLETESKITTNSLITHFDALESTVHTHSRNKSFLEQTDLYEEIERYVDQMEEVKEVVLLQYSAMWATSLIRKLARKNANITLFVQAPETAVSDSQKEKILTISRQMDENISRSNPFTLTIYEYNAPASIRAVLIDRKILGIGPYVYEYMFSQNENFPDDRFEISGHDMPGRLFYEGTLGFQAFSVMIDKIVANYKKYYEVNNLTPRVLTNRS